MIIFWAASVPTLKSNANLTVLSAHSPRQEHISANAFPVAPLSLRLRKLQLRSHLWATRYHHCRIEMMSEINNLQ